MRGNNSVSLCVRSAGVLPRRAPGLRSAVSGMSAQSRSVHRGVCTEPARGKAPNTITPGCRSHEQKLMMCWSHVFSVDHLGAGVLHVLYGCGAAVRHARTRRHPLHHQQRCVHALQNTDYYRLSFVD